MSEIIKYAIVEPAADGSEPVIYFRKFGKNGVAKFADTSKWWNRLIDIPNVAVYDKLGDAEKVIDKLNAMLPHRKFVIKEMRYYHF